MFKIRLKNGYLVISKEISVVLIMDVFAVAYYAVSRGLSTESMMFPTFLLAGIILFSIVCYVQNIHICKEITEEEREKINSAAGFGISKKLGLFVLMVLATLLLFDLLGALISCWLFLVCSMWILDVRNKWVLILVPLFEVVFIYFVFVAWLAVPLPEGLLTFL